MSPRLPPILNLSFRHSFLTSSNYVKQHTRKLTSDTEIYPTINSGSSQSPPLAPATPGRPYNLYAWGKTPLGHSMKLKYKPSSPGGVESNSLVHYDPIQVDLNNFFCIDNKSVTLRSITCGATSIAAILSNNTCYTFGANQYGQLGHSNRDDNYAFPTILNPPSSTPLHYDEISKISLGPNFSAIVDTGGNLYTCGYDGSILHEGQGCLGQGYLSDTEYLVTPTLVTSLVEDGIYASQVAVGASHMAVLTTEGEVLTTGAGTYGRCGNLKPVDQFFLKPVEMLSSETDVCQIVAGKDFTLALTKQDGIVFAFGKNDKGQCGTGTGLSVEMYAMESMPIPVEGMLEGRKVIKIAAGQSHAAVITENGELFVWGMGQSQLPQLISTLEHTKFVDVDCGHDYTLVVDDEGKLYSFGKGNNTGVLGLGKDQNKAVQPMLVEGLMGKMVVGVSAGWNNVACLVDEGIGEGGN